MIESYPRLNQAVMLLQGSDGHFVFLERADRLHARFSGGEVGAVADLMLHRAGTNFDLVLAGLMAARGVDDEMDVSILHHVDHVGALLLGKFIKSLHGNPFGFETFESAAGSMDLEAKFGEVTSDGDGAILVAIVDGEEDIALFGERVKALIWDLA